MQSSSTTESRLSAVRASLDNTSIFVDFDGTISLQSVSAYLLHQMGDPSWKAIDAAFLRGEIGGRECMTEEWKCLRGHSEEELRSVAAEVPLDPGFTHLVAAARKHNSRLEVLSDGFGFYVEAATRSLGVTVRTNAVNFGSHTITFPNADANCPCAACGTCKAAPIRSDRGQHRHTVFIGDGFSDRHAAVEADLVFAKHRLAAWCDSNDVAYLSYDNLYSVTEMLFRPPAGR